MEGSSPDKRLLNRFIDAFSKEMQIDGSQVIAVYGTNIYTLYSEFKSLLTKNTRKMLMRSIGAGLKPCLNGSVI